MTVVIENAGSWVVGTFPSAPRDATPLATAIALLFTFAFNAFCVSVLMGLFISEVLSTLSNPKLVLKPATVELPVPPLAIAIIPVTFVALPVNVPANTPFASLFTTVFARFVLVAVAKALTVAAMLSLVFPPTSITKGAVAVPPKSPASNIFPFDVVVAS